MEADFEPVDGVIDVVSGVAGGTGHLAMVEITYGAEILPYDRLLHPFLRAIDPTDAQGQFCDRGPTRASASRPQDLRAQVLMPSSR